MFGLPFFNAEGKNACTIQMSVYSVRAICGMSHPAVFVFCWCAQNFLSL